jgi:hypothetical protein
MNRRLFLASVAGFAAASRLHVAVPGASASSPVLPTSAEPATVLEWDFTAEDYVAFVARRTASVPAA